MNHNLFVPDIVTAKALIDNYLSSDQITINLFVVERDTLQNVLNDIKKDKGHLTVTGVSLKTDKRLYPGKKHKGSLSKEERKLFIKRLAGQTFKIARGSIATGFVVTKDGDFQNIDNNKIYKSPSSAIEDYFKGKVKHPNTNGWGDPKNDQGYNLDQAIRNLFD